MLNEDAVLTTIGGAGGITLFIFLARIMLKQFSSGVLDFKSDNARGDIIADLRKEVDRMQARLETLEGKVAKLTDRLVTVRSHALNAYSLLSTHENFGNTEREIILASLAQIIKED